MSWIKSFSVLVLAVFATSLAFCQSGYIQVSSFPTSAVCDGHSQVVLTAVVTDSRGNAVPDGTQVDFETDLGSFRQNLVTIQSGRAQAVLIAGLLPGLANITIKTLGLSISPIHSTVEFVSNRSLLSQSSQVVEIVCKSDAKYDASNKIVFAEGDNQGVSFSFRDVFIKADKLQFKMDTMEVRATNATLHLGSKYVLFSELRYNLTSLSGEGLADYTPLPAEPVPTLKAGSKLTVDPIKEPTKPAQIEEKLFGHVDVSGLKVTPSKSPYLATNFSYYDLDLAPAIVQGVKINIVPQREIQFEKASIYVGDAHVMSLPLYRVMLNTSTPLITDQIVSVNNNQLAVSYPYYLSLGPGQTSFLRFHLGDSGGLGFGAGNGPQMDYELDWSHGDSMEGGFLLNGLGQSTWGVGLHQYYRLADNSSIYAQIQSPKFQSIFGSLNANKQFGVYNLSAASTVSKTLVGITTLDQSSTLNLLRDPEKLGKLPVRLTYGLTAGVTSTNAAIAIPSQTSYGLTANLQFDPLHVDRSTTINSSIGANYLKGTNVGSGIGFTFSSLLSRRISNFASVTLGYSYTQDPFQISRFGAQRITGTAYFSKGGAYTQLSSGMSLGLNNFDASAETGYRFAKDWRVGTDYAYSRYIGDSFLDYGVTLYYRIGFREFGITWTEQTKRIGIVILGATLN